MKNTSLRLACLALIALLPGVASAFEFAAAGSNFSIATNSLKAIRFQSTLRQQYDFSCGSAAVATLLTYQYGLRVTEQEAFNEMFANGDQQKIRIEGFSLLDIKRFLAARALEADGFEVGLDTLAETRVPAIALVQDNGYNHFVVVKGVRGDRVLIGDPSFGVRSISRTKFEAMWTNRVLFVVHNRQELAAFNRNEDWRLAPAPPLADAVARAGLDHATMAKQGPGEF